MTERPRYIGRSALGAHALACAILLAAALVMFADVLAAGNGRLVSMANEDTTRPFFYWFPFGFGELRRGHLVLWNPHTYAGTPYFGSFGPALLYPPNWLHMALPTAIAINVGVTLHVFLAGAFVYAWAHHRRLHPAACVMAGLVFMFGGAQFLQIYRGHLHCLSTLVWAPLIFLAIDGVRDGSSRAWPLLGMAAVAMQIFAGHVQYTFYTAITAGLYGLLGWLATGRRWRDPVGVVAIYGGGACLAAVQLLTGLQTVAESHRVKLTYGMAAWLGFPPENLLTLVLPRVFGDMVRTPYWGQGTISEMSLFMGVAPFVLMLCGIARGDGRARFLALAVVAAVLVLAFGDYTPLFHVLYDHVPGFASFRGTTKFIFLAALFMTMLAAMGLDVILRGRGAPVWLGVASVVLGGVLLAAGAPLGRDCRTGGTAIWVPFLRRDWCGDASQLFGDDGPALATACGNMATSLLVGGGTFVLVGLLMLASRRRPRLAYVIAIVGAIEVMTYARSMLPSFDPTLLARLAPALQQALAERHAGDARILSQDPYSYVALGAGAFDLWGAEPAVPGRYSELVRRTQAWPEDAVMTRATMERLSPRLGMLRLRYRFEVRNEQVVLQPTNLPELPRALLVPDWKVVSDGGALLDTLLAPTFDPRRQVLLESDPGLAPDTADAEEPGQVVITDVSTEVLEVQAEVRRPSILVVTDNYSASWKATPWEAGSAETYRVMPADYTLRAIPLPPGHHHIRLEYRPSALGIGTGVSLVALALYLGAVLSLMATPARWSWR